MTHDPADEPMTGPIKTTAPKPFMILEFYQEDLPRSDCASPARSIFKDPEGKEPDEYLCPNCVIATLLRGKLLATALEAVDAQLPTPKLN